MKQISKVMVRWGLAVVVALAGVVPGWAATATWTNTTGNASDYWTNNVNWNAASYPGSVVFDESAYLTNAAAGAYTNILGFTVGRRIATLAISNSLGEAWLVVTNAVLTNTTFAINSGGRLRIDDGGVVTGITSFTWLGTNGVIELNNGGRLFTTGASQTIGAFGSVTGLVTSASGPGNGGVWNRNGGVLIIGNGTSGHDNVLRVTDGAIVTNAGGVTIAGNRNSLVAANGGGVFGAGAIGFSGAGQYGNTIELGEGAWNLNNTALNVGSGANASNNSFSSFGGISNVIGLSVGSAVGANYNSVVLTNGGSLVMASGAISIGAAGAAGGGHQNTVILSNAVINASGNVYLGTGSSNNTVELLGNTVWNNGSQIFHIGRLAGSNNVVTLNGAILTNVNTLQLSGNTGAGSGNQLIVKNGGMISNIAGIVTVGGNLNANFNSLIVTDNASFFMNNASAVTIGGNGSGNNSMLLSNSVVRSGALSIGSSGGSNNVLTLFQDTVWSTFGAAVTVGSGAAEGNVLTVAGALVTNVGTVAIGSAGNAINNQLRIGNGGSISNIVGGLTIGGGVGANNNSLIATSGGTFFMTTGGAINIGANGGAAGGHGNLMIVSNSVIRLNGIVTYIGTGSTNNTVELLGNSVWDNDGALFRIGWLAGSNNSVTVDGGILSNVSTLLVGGSSTATGNRLIVKNGGTLSNVTTISLGAQNGANNNALVADGGQIFMAAGSLTVGGGTSVGNSVVLNNGALLQANSLITASGAGNTISNVNSTYQFTVGTPTVTAGSGAGSIAITDGTISFLGTALNLTNNWGGPLANIAFAGANALRLDNSTASNTVVAGYIFNTGLGATNYYRLEMVNGTTAVSGNGVTIGATGALLISNTAASLTGPFTNHGLTRLVGAGANFGNGIINSGELSLQAATLTGAVTNLASGTLRGDGLIVGDVMSFGTNSPGFSVGTLSITGTVTFGSTAVTWLELFSDGSNDVIRVSGLLTYGGELVVSNSTGFAFAAGQSFQVFEFGSQTGMFGVTNLPDLLSESLTWDTTQLDTTGLLMIAVIPEPSAWALVLGGLVIWWALGRRSRRRR